MATLYDADNNEIENALTPEEAKTLLDKAAELEATLKEKQEELEKFRSKDMNFSKFRDKTEEEKTKIMEKASEREKMILRDLDDMTKEREAEKKSQFEAAKASLLNQLAGDDKDLQKSIELRAKEWGEPKTIEELEKKYSDAHTLLRSSKPDISPINRWSPVTGYQAPPQAKAFVETPQGTGLYARMFPDSPIAKQK